MQHLPSNPGNQSNPGPERAGTPALRISFSSSSSGRSLISTVYVSGFPAPDPERMRTCRAAESASAGSERQSPGPLSAGRAGRPDLLLKDPLAEALQEPQHNPCLEQDAGEVDPQRLIAGFHVRD